MKHNHCNTTTILLRLSLLFMLLIPTTMAAGNIRGDVNDDGSLSIADVTTLIDYILGQTSNINLANADVNRDDDIGIADVTLLIDAMLGNVTFPPNEEEFLVGDVSFTMMPVEGGTFMMGATAEQGSDGSDRERPVHQVTLDTYFIGQTEVTQELWIAVMGSNPSQFPGSTNPVENVSWEDCQEFIATLNQLTGRTFRLPTEAEWEFAARGGNESQGYKYAGSDIITSVAWYSGNDAWQIRGTGSYGTHPVATRMPNELMLFDMSGNVHEWCQDWFAAYTSGDQLNPTGPATGNARVYRGGSWYFDEWFCRVSFRNSVTPTYRSYGIGLRLAL